MREYKPLLTVAVLMGKSICTNSITGKMTYVVFTVSTVGLAAFGFTLLTLFAGLIGGISSGSRQLPWETLRVFPVRDTTLFGAELFAGAGEAITLLELSALGVACVGASVGAPLASPLVLLLFVTHALA